MSGIEKQMEKEKTKVSVVDTQIIQSKSKGTRADIDDEDDEESYYRYEIQWFLAHSNKICMRKID